MKKYFKIVYPLAVIAAAIGLILGAVYQLIEPRLAEAEKRELENALKRTVASAETFSAETVNGQLYYRAVGPGVSGEEFAFVTSEKGYGGPVVSVVGITNGAVEKVLILELEKETPGLGTRAKDPRWLEQFSGITPEKIPQNRQGFKDNGLDALSGATLTSMAVASDIRDAFAVYAMVTETNKNANEAVKGKNKKKKKKKTAVPAGEGGNEN